MISAYHICLRAEGLSSRLALLLRESLLEMVPIACILSWYLCFILILQPSHLSGKVVCYLNLIYLMFVEWNFLKYTPEPEPDWLHTAVLEYTLL